MKVKVKVIQISLRGNKVAQHGQVIDHKELPVPGNWLELIKEGYLEHTKESKAVAKSEKKALKKSKKAAKEEGEKDSTEGDLDDNLDNNTKDNDDADSDLDNSDNDDPSKAELLAAEIAELQDKNKENLLVYAEGKGIEVSKRDKKSKILETIIAAISSDSEEE